ncbi:hypothetical protein [Nodularia spumigena]|uniref:hypothetical protein n=1 Tax=Nodularia spumigena TaxID=70799 RepID=UPI002B1F3435|nr:hypothetical protein [Nodularia spumigena]MEA5615429.1 hypothetical protein [Nodularia spumigena UHCC 0040]
MSPASRKAAPVRPATPRTRAATRLFAGVCAALTLLGHAACSSTNPTPRPLLTGQARSTPAADPSRSPYHGWDAIDTAVKAGAIEHLVVATPVETIGVRFRTYRLLGSRDQPGELLVERTDEGVALTIRLGRFGLPELEQQVLDQIRAELAKAP